MRGHKREAARRVCLLLAIVGWCAALVLCSCEATEEFGAERMLIVGKWARPGETIEFRSNGRMMAAGPDKHGRVKNAYFIYWIEREGEITVRPVGFMPMGGLKRWDFRVSGDELYLKLRGEREEKVYHRANR